MLKLYQVEWCPQCHRVRQLLTELGLTYTAVNVAEDPAERDEVVSVSDQNAVPVLVDGDKVVAGSEDIAAYLTATYPPAADAEEHAVHGAWRAVTLTSLDPAAALEQLRELLTQNGFSIVSQITGPQINDRLPDSYVLLQAAVPIASLKAIEIDPTAVSAVLLPLAVVPIQEGSAIVAADPVGQVWLFASPELRKVQSMVKKRLADVFEGLAVASM
jgi:glutaredoxin 3